MYTELNKHCEEGNIISCYCDTELSDSFIVGRIIFVNEDYTIIESIHVRGEYDGYVLIDNEDIFRIDYNGKYEKKVELLYSLKKQKHSLLKKNDFSDVQNDIVIFVFLKKVLKLGVLAKLSINSDDDDVVIGLIEEVGDCSVTVSQIDEYGDSLGYVTIFTESISRVAVDGIDEQVITFLRK